MITLQKLSIKNFMIIESVEFDFKEASFHVIVGDNGAGKSAMLDALALILFENKRADSYKEYVRYGCEQAILHLEATFKGSAVVFDININSSEKKLPLERKMTYQEKEYVNSEIKTFLQENVDLSVIENVMFSMQKEDSNISKLSPSQRRDLFKNMFNITFEDESKIIQNNINTLSSEVSSYNTELNQLKNKKFIKKSTFDTIPNEEVSRFKDLVYKNREELNVLKSYKSVQETYIRLKRNRVQLDGLIEDNKKHQSKIDSIENDPNLKSKNTWSIKELEDHILVLLQNISEHSTNTVNIKMAIAEKLTSLKHEKEHEQDHLDGMCVRCHRPLDQAENTAWENKVNQMEADLTILRKDLSLEENSITKTQDNLKNLKIKLSNEEQAKRVYDNKISEAIQNKKFSSYAIQTNNETINNLRADINEMEKDLPVIPESFNSNSIQEKETAIQKLEKILSERDILLGQNKTIEENNRQLVLDEKENVIKIDDIVKKINKANMDINSNEAAMNILTVDLVNYSIVKTCGLLEDYINEFIESVKADVKIKLIQTKKGVDLYYTPISALSTEVSNWSSVKMASGFEQDLINVAFKIGLAKAYNLKVLILDEIDSASTESNSYKLFSLIAKISDFDNVIIITHKPEVQKILSDEQPSVICYRVEKGQYNVE